MKSSAAPCVVAVLLVACGSAPPAPPPPAPAAVPRPDINLVSAPIPMLLLEAQRAPYAEPADGTCAGIAAQIVGLDAVLGADFDVTPGPANPSLVERGGGAVSPGSSPAPVASESVVPFRPWVRPPSGAERYSRDVAAAIAAGSARRSYLKGIGAVRGCRPPAAPAATERS